MKLQTKVTVFSAILAATLIAALVAIGLVSFRQFLIAAATEHIRTSADIVRVGLTEAMINGVIDKRESFLTRLTDVPGLQSARVLPGPLVEKQFGHGLSREQPADEIERQVLAHARV